VSLTRPAIAVNDRLPATTAPAHNASTTATGCRTHRTRRGSLTCAEGFVQQIHDRHGGPDDQRGNTR
jgi:hypothetical protein